ncbi:helix-turn-helix transcriptional regulator [Saccharopolyspora hirsuta]|uniref:Helix-turn-helix transcriptional regulator n=1 Tax=Saccharopolyspora hirsuta TaxID=1837 RepID=A0A5M7BN48_SACHI|nr:helix-turn-helix transcriptional regulator [Saccharopolyspora hirsuta]KAA5829568.1 helix-turn-helix transcriptional regulator [Saccharopolyspora hirsuta]
MANERLRAALRAAGFTLQELAQQVEVDTKTVERWISLERVPHRRTRRKVAELVKTDEVQLWPSLANDLYTKPNEDTEIVHIYPSRSSVPFALWEELISGVQEHMEVLVFSGQFLVEQHNILPIIRRKSEKGVAFRFIVGDETSDTVIQRAIEEGTTGGLEGRIQMMRRYLSKVSDLPNVEVRTHSTILYNSLYRFDDQLLVNGHAYGALAGENPVMHLRRVPQGQMWDHYMNSFERVWQKATPDTI